MRRCCCRRSVSEPWSIAVSSRPAGGQSRRAWHESGLVFTSRLGTPVDPRNFHRAFVDRTTRAGVPVTPVHLTRKACASLLVALDVHPRVAMQILRHSKIAVTMEVYAEVVSSSTKEALRRLGEQLDSGNAA